MSHEHFYILEGKTFLGILYFNFCLFFMPLKVDKDTTGSFDPVKKVTAGVHLYLAEVRSV